MAVNAGTGAANATNVKDANNAVDNQENLNPDNRLDLRISELDLGKKLPPPRPHRAVEQHHPPELSPRKTSAMGGVAGSGGMNSPQSPAMPIPDNTDRNANKSSLISTGLNAQQKLSDANLGKSNC